MPLFVSFQPEPWRDRAACTGTPPDMFFPEIRVTARTLDEYDEQVAAAKAVCDDCPVTADCLTSTLRYESGAGRYRHGIFGGLTPDERALLPAPEREVAPIRHGDRFGAQAHRNRGEVPCGACLDAEARYQKVWRDTRPDAADRRAQAAEVTRAWRQRQRDALYDDRTPTDPEDER